MLFRLAPVAVLAIACGAFSASSQTVREMPGPFEVPPASFKGAQYVDSRGCVFVRAGVDGTITWVPRVNAARKVLCGYPPTLTAMADAADGGTDAAEAPVAAAPAAPARNPTAVAEVPEVSPATPQPKAAARKKPDQAVADQTTTKGYVDTPRATGVPGQIACPARAPLARRFPLQGGGTVVLCLSRDDLLNDRAAVSVIENAAPLAARAPLGQQTVLVCPKSAPVGQRLPQVNGGATVLCTTGDGRTANLAVPVRRLQEAPVAVAISRPAAVDPALPALVIPPGYKAAWKDDRLNPNRAKGTAAGQLAQDQIWTREVPARLVSEVGGEEPASVGSNAGSAEVRISTRSTAAVSQEGTLVQVGSFARPGNAERAAARLEALGYPVAVGRMTRGGTSFQIVFAGPFDTTQAKAALKTLRRSGFPDAIMTR